MSKTKKIKRLERKVKELQSSNDLLHFSNSELMKDLQYKPASVYYTPRPEVRSDDLYEEREYNNLMNYIYTAMDNEYRKVFDTEPPISYEDVKFTAYMSTDIIGRLSSLHGYQDFRTNARGVCEFRGHEVVRVIGENYVHFVRKMK